MAKAKAAGESGQGKYAHYDVDTVRAAASRRWPEILSAVFGIPRESLDGKHHPCPCCGGSDRFRLFTDDSGGAICNQCHRDKNGDGFATGQWVGRCDFHTALRRIAEYIGIAPIENGKPGRGRPRNDGANADPAEHLEFQSWSDALVELLFCPQKLPITCQAIQAAGGRLARYRDRFTVIALPVWGEQLQSAAPVGWCLYNVSGDKTLPTGKKKDDGTYDQVKVKLTWGSKPGIIGPVERIAAHPAGKPIWKTEGPSDLLALLSFPDAPLAWTNSNGAGERPSNWIPKLFAGHSINVVHDADKPGQDGATYKQQSDGQYRPGWCPSLAAHAGETGVVKNIVLPYEVADTHGKDLRDWINEGGTLEQLQSMADASPVFSLPESSSNSAATTTKGDSTFIVSATNEGPDNFHRLARINLRRYAQSTPNGTLRFWKNEWYKYDGFSYRLIDNDELKAKVGQAIKEEFDRLNVEDLANWNGKGEPPTVRNVGAGLASSVIFATAQTQILSGSVKLNSWIDGPLKNSTRRYVALRNGILDIDALLAKEPDYLKPHSPNWFSVTCLPFDFNPEATCPRWFSFLRRNMESDIERISILMEWAGYLLLPNTDFQKFMFLEGEGANGKSVYLAAIEAMIGEANCCHVSLESFANDFMRTQILGKLVNIASECSEMDSVAEGFLKGIASGDRMTFNRKGIPPIEATPTARLMLSANVRPRFADKSSGLWRRMLLMPWRVTIPEGDRIIGMDKIDWWERSGELPGIFNWAVAGLHQLSKQKRFTKSKICEAALADYKHEVNPVKGFIEETYVEDIETDGHFVTTKMAYDQYKEWSIERGYRPVSDRTFGREIARSFKNVTREQKRNPVDKSRYYAYVGMRYRTPEDDGEEIPNLSILKQEEAFA